MRMRILLSIIISLSLCLSLASQGVTTASISGKITDNDGQPLLGANIIAIHVPTLWHQCRC